MRISIRGVHFKLTLEIKRYTEQKIGKLAKYWNKIISAEVHLIYNQGLKQGRKNVVNVRLEVPGNDIEVEKRASSMEEAIDLCEDKLKILIEKHKNKANLRRFWVRQKEFLRRIIGQ